VWSEGKFLFTRGFIDVLGKRATGFHRKAKFVEVNTFTRKTFLSGWSNQRGDKIIVTADQ